MSGHGFRRLFRKLSERAAMLRRDRVKATRIAVALVGREGEFAPADNEPAFRSLSRNVDHEPDSARIPCSRLRGVHGFELCFESSAYEATPVVYAIGYGVIDPAPGHQRREFRRRRRS